MSITATHGDLRRARRAAVEAIDTLSEAAGGAALDWAPDQEVADCLLDLLSVRRRLEATIADVSARFASGTVWSGEGFRSARDWMRSRTTDGFGPAMAALEGGDWLVQFPAMGDAWRGGAVSRAHVKVLADAHMMFPRLSEALVSIESDLVAHAAAVDPATFRRILFAQLHQIDPQAIDDADARKRRHAVGLHVSTVIDGFVRVDGLLPPEVGQQLLAALASARDALTAKDAEPYDPFSLDDAEPATPPQAGQRLSARNVEALGLILDAASSAVGADRLPDLGGVRPVVHITVDSTSLSEQGANAPGWISSLTGTPITPITVDAARRLSCDAIAELLLVNAAGALDAISARWRTAPPGMRRYVLMRDNGRCRFPGCQSRIREVHHIRHWSDGGPTVTANLVGLCSHHHHLVHEGRWRLTGDPDQKLIFTDRLGREWSSAPPPRE